ncbi:MAG TPA: hypothetical protein VFT41_01315 [Gemmatimonadaceae bacterium]|nr:hypothetical protein [Gemmatimonadaceae bacterium]
MVQLFAAVSAFGAAACGGSSNTGTGPTGPTGTGFKVNPCSVGGTLQLAVAQAARVDCSNGGTTVTVAGNGASYLIVPEFPTDQAQNTPVTYSLAAGEAAAASRGPAASLGLPGAPSTTERLRPANLRQQSFDAAMRSRAARMVSSGAFQRASAQYRASFSRTVAPPPVGSTRSFRVLSSIQNSNYQWKTVGAQLVYAGANVLLYIDTLAPAGGFTASQLQQFGQYFDGTLYPIDTTDFGQPSDVDNNGHVIMLMSPVVNGLSPSAQCSTQGFVAGFFDQEDFAGPTDPNSNQGEIFYSIVPDPNGSASCVHTVSDVEFDIPATFLHELQHLINFSQHVIVHNGPAETGWLDEGLSIIAEEAGAVHYEQKCPPPSCRTDPSQIFPDSAESFVQGFLYDSYQYALLPDTASVTLHSDSDNGFSWRGGDWLLMRYLGDQTNNGVFRKLEDTYATGVANIEAAMGTPFPTLFSDFGLALYTDSLPGLPRNTAPAVDRFVTRNMPQLWARLYVTSGPSADVPYPAPVRLFSITADTSSSLMSPGTTAYYRLDTPQTAATVTIQFSAPGAHALPTALHPQLAIFRLPPGQ